MRVKDLKVAQVITLIKEGLMQGEINIMGYDGIQCVLEILNHLSGIEGVPKLIDSFYLRQ